MELVAVDLAPKLAELGLSGLFSVEVRQFCLAAWRVCGMRVVTVLAAGKCCAGAGDEAPRSHQER